MLTIGESKPDSINPDNDLEWNQSVTMKIGPHPGLSDAAKKAIELDYGMDNGFLAVTTRLALLFYAERRMGLDFDPDTVSPNRQQIVLLNREEVEEAHSAIRRLIADQGGDNK